MANIRQIKRRIRSVQSTAKITNAMSMVAASKMRRAQQRGIQGRPYAQQIRAVMSNLMAVRQADAAHPLLAPRGEVKRIAYIHVTADRGLCGPLNANMNRAGAGLALEYQPKVERVSVVTVGRKGRDFFRRAGFPSLAEFSNLGDYPGMQQILPIARVVMDDYIAGNIDQVFIGYQRFVSTAVQRPTVRQILPVTAPEGVDGGESVDFLFEPSPEQLLETLLPRYVEMQVYEAVLDALASEQSARMVAMQAATDAANEMVAGLTLTYNKARQELITGELLDIVGGSAALEG